MKLRIVIWWLLLIIGALAATVPPAESADRVPTVALKFQRDLTRNARAVWGLDAPTATFAAQIHQESAWRTDARSPYASGLAQFTPATADEISSRYRDELGANQPLNPSWALRALVRYDLELWSRVTAATPCDRAAFMLASYNGGPGGLDRDRAYARKNGADPNRWWGNVELWSRKAPQFFTENRGYPKRILLRWQSVYASWGPGIDCSQV